MFRFADEKSGKVLELLKSNAEGLSDGEAAERCEKFGKNQLKEKKRKSIAGLFFSQFGDVMTILLIAAACISAVIACFSGDTHDLVDTGIIVFIILLNAAVGTVQQYRADKAIEGLKKLTSTRARVKRGGKIYEIDAAYLTVGDIVLLEEGDVVPADMRVIKSTGLKCDEASLTGESFPVEKTETAKSTKPKSYADATNLLFSSSFVVGGSGEGVVTAIGKDTEIGGIAGMLEEVKKGGTPLEKSLNKLGKIISGFVICVAAAIFIVGLVVNHTGILKNFMTAVAIAVAAIPEGLPAVVSVIMAMGVQRMSRENVVIRKLKCVETLGGCSCICTDKTGTLTQNKMTVTKTYSPYGEISSDSLLCACMSVCTRVKRSPSGYIGDSTEVAIKTFADGCGFKDTYAVTGEIPFSSDRKMMSVSAERQSEKFVFVKGAPEEVLKRCNISEVERKEAEKAGAEMSANALRVLAFAYKKSGNLTEDNLIFLGLCGMMDDIKEGVKEAVESCKRAGVATVMITGDSPATAFAIANKAGIAESFDEVFTGAELDNMTKPQLKDAVRRGRVFARVSPRHKNVIVNLKKADGEVVAMTGDGVNDAPSVKSADIGIVMGKSGTEVTKSVADMVIADDNFTTIVTAVKEGRRISSNVKKTIDFFIATNLAEVLAIVIATFAFIGYAFLPSTQLLWINLITDSFPVLALGVERGSGDEMNHLPIRAEKALFSKRSLVFVFASALYITGVIIGAYAFTLFNFGGQEAVTVAFLTMSFAELFHAFNVRSGNNSALSGLLTNKVLLLTVTVGVLVNVALCFSPLASAFGLVKLPLKLLLLSFGASLSVIVFGEIYKLISRLVRPARGTRSMLKTDSKRSFKKSAKRA